MDTRRGSVVMACGACGSGGAEGGGAGGGEGGRGGFGHCHLLGGGQVNKWQDGKAPPEVA